MPDDFDDEDREGGPEAFIDQREKPTRVGLVVPDVRAQPSRHSIAARQGEFEGLASAIAVDRVFTDVLKVRDIKPGTFLGQGQVDALRQQVKDNDVELLLVDAALSPVQQRNLETETKAKVLDRTGLILEIFGERAATREGVLQVELAHLNYQKGRLVRSWTHLERQRGGFGFLGGPGETQIETDRRLLQERITAIEERLEKVKKTRAQQRGGGRDARFPTVALVGYTNSGKSTLFNALTGATVFAKDLLFATLDTTLRKLALPHGRDVMLSDTVGFVSELPTQLVAAFKATLEEVVSADLLIHVRDIAHPDSEAQRADVEAVLREIGVADTTPRFEAWNKIDLLDTEQREDARAEAARRDDVVALSAMSGEGVEELKREVAAKLTAGHRRYSITLDAADGAGAAWLHQHGEVLEQEIDGDRATYDVRMAPRDYERFQQR